MCSIVLQVEVCISPLIPFHFNHNVSLKVHLAGSLNRSCSHRKVPPIAVKCNAF